MKIFLQALPLLCLAAGCLHPLAVCAQTNAAGENSGQALVDDKGNIFMEEVDVPKQKKIEKVPVDLSRVGVSVDPKGNIVPLKDGANDFWAGSGVKPFYNKIEQSTELPYGLPGLFGYAPYYPGLNKTWNPGGSANYYGYPYGVGFNPYGAGYPYSIGLNYGSPYYYPYSANPFGYGPSYPSGNPNFYGNSFNNSGLLFGNPYGYGNSPGYLNLFGYGNALSFANPYGYSNAFPYANPYGYPYGYPGGQPLATLRLGNFQATVGAGPFFRPTTYTQTSMWKAFNLAF